MLIGLIGSKGAGKTTAAQILCLKHKFVIEPLAKPLKDMLKVILPDEAFLRNNIEEPLSILQGKSPRYAMQTLGAEWGRNCLGRDFWLDVWQCKVDKHLQLKRNVVCDDVRFPNECARIKRTFQGFLIKISRPGPSKEDSHISEYLWKLPDYYCYSIVNDGSFSQLEEKLAKLLPILC